MLRPKDFLLIRFITYTLCRLDMYVVYLVLSRILFRSSSRSTFSALHRLPFLRFCRRRIPGAACGVRRPRQKNTPGGRNGNQCRQSICMYADGASRRGNGSLHACIPTYVYQTHVICGWVLAEPSVGGAFDGGHKIRVVLVRT